MRGNDSGKAHAPAGDPIFSNPSLTMPPLQLRQGPSFGLRYDWSEFVALKLQYDYTILTGNQSFSTVALQTGFTF